MFSSKLCSNKTVLRFVPLIFLLLITGCAGLSNVTPDRCRQLPLEEIGYRDGRDGKRPGDGYDFWLRDCRANRVPLDRGLYDSGYTRGLAEYCSCAEGARSGLKKEYLEMKGQYYTCKRVDYARFAKAHEKASSRGLAVSEDLERIAREICDKL